jgi:hypothetical protein
MKSSLLIEFSRGSTGDKEMMDNTIIAKAYS